MIFITGGAGFIGSSLVRRWVDMTDEPIVNIDALTYAGNCDNLAGVGDSHRLVVADISDRAAISDLFAAHRPRAIMHLAAESHVDRSIRTPGDFVRTNVTGTFTLLDAARAYWLELPDAEKSEFRFLHVSTDEVYGSLGPTDPPFSETTPYAPNSPYSASKAASDHFARAYFHTYGLPVVTTNCSNNYGPRQFPEKLIPLCIVNALAGKALPIYGDGSYVRDWLYVGDHCDALLLALERGRPGEVYNIGGWNELTNLTVVRSICDVLDTLRPLSSGRRYADQISFVTDRPGHDRRYAIDARKIERELGWKPRETFETGLRKTVEWYLANAPWTERVQSEAYRSWTAAQYGAVA